MTYQSPQDRDLILLEKLEQDPQATQASLASQLGVAVGTVNWHIKRLIEKGYIKVKRAERRKLQYIITPEGLAMRAKLTVDYIRSSMELYRLIRRRMTDVIDDLKRAGHHKAVLRGGTADVLDICKLTCLEQGIEILTENNSVPAIVIDHLKIRVKWEPNEDTAYDG
ncbi:MAG: winged helix-turn-helix transcriptional regulator [Anaerolineaceae bacterium]|nr:winged helix-turn-helix transcriptional regulator [Anaerolineaceae bacterium]